MHIQIDYAPRGPQIAIHEGMDAHRFSVVVAHRRMGKTVCMINQLIKRAALCPLPRPRYAYIAPFLTQAKTVAWDYLKHFTSTIPGVSRNESELWVELPNNARIRIHGADNPNSLRGGYFDGVILDEVADMRKEVWGEIIRPAISDRLGWAAFIGTPKGLNLFHELYQQACRDPDWFAAMYTADETGIVPAEELEAARKTMSEDQYRQEYLCDFQASVENALIPIDLALQAAGRALNESAYYFAPVVMGLDVAAYGDDQSVLVKRQGLASWILQKWHKIDHMELADVVVHLARGHGAQALFVDGSVVATGLISRMHQLGYMPIPINFGGSPNDARFLNRRAEMWFGLRDWLREGGSVPDDRRLLNDLVSPTYKMTASGRLQLESKEAMKERGLVSTDYGDALALTFAHDVAGGVSGLYHDAQRQEVADSDFPLFGGN